jgi:hypothetical protein
MKIFNCKISLEEHILSNHSEYPTEEMTLSPSKNKIKRVNSNILCDHQDCNLTFSSKGRKIMHHNKQEPECNNEKKSTIKLISYYKSLILKLSKSNLQNNKNKEKLLEIKNDYEVLLEKLYDNEYFSNVCGLFFGDISN